MTSFSALKQLLRHRLADILRREHSADSQLYLYRTGDCYVTFERSAHLLASLCPECQTVPFYVPDTPFPMVLSSIPADHLPRLRSYARCTRSGSDYLSYTPLQQPTVSYDDWHREQVKVVAGGQAN